MSNKLKDRWETDDGRDIVVLEDIGTSHVDIYALASVASLIEEQEVICPVPVDITQLHQTMIGLQVEG